MTKSYKTLCLVMCSAEKTLIASAPAAELYRSQRCEADRQAILELGYEWLILSGKHGLVHPAQIVDTYEVSLDRAWYLTLLRWRFLVAFRLVKQIGFSTGFIVSISARGAYQTGAVGALRLLGFRPYPKQS